MKKKFKAKEDYFPLYRKGDEFIIVKVNKDPDLMPIEAMRLKNKAIYGFEKEEIGEFK